MEDDQRPCCSKNPDDQGSPLPKQRARKICNMHGCREQARTGGLCMMHFTSSGYALNQMKGNTCSVEGCDLAVLERGVCCKHSSEPGSLPVKRKRKTCSASGCGSVAQKGGFCMKHSTSKGGLPVRRQKKTCSKNGCTSLVRKKGLCKKHLASLGAHVSAVGEENLTDESEWEDIFLPEPRTSVRIYRLGLSRYFHAPSDNILFLGLQRLKGAGCRTKFCLKKKGEKQKKLKNASSIMISKLRYIERKLTLMREHILQRCRSKRRFLPRKRSRTGKIKSRRKVRQNVEVPEDFGRRYLSAININWLPCSCCTVVLPVVRLKRNRELKHGHLSADALLCEKCLTFDSSKTGVCKYSHNFNNLDPGEGLGHLGFMELQAIRMVQPFIRIVRVPYGLTHAKGQVVHVVSDVDEGPLHLLPRPSSDIFLAVDQKKPSRFETNNAGREDADTVPKISKPKKPVRYAVDLKAVEDSLTFLKENNPLYSDVTIDLSAVQEGQRCELEETLVKINVFDSYALIDFKGAIPLEYTFGPSRQLPCYEPATWTMSDGCEQRAYPHLFPLGIAGELSPRPVEISLSDYYKLRFSCADNRFQSDDSYVFRCLNVYQRKQMENNIGFHLGESGRFAKVNANMNTLKNVVYPHVAKRLRGTDAYFRTAKSNLRNMVDSVGAPQLFLSVNLRNCTELLCNLNPERFGFPNAPRYEEIDCIPEDELTKIIDDNCGLAARMFDRRTRQFITILKDKKDPFFPGCYYAEHVFVKIEFQRAGYPHLHCLVWLNTKFNAETEKGKKRAVSYLDKLLTTELPDVTKDPLGFFLVNKYQRHIHTFTCRKGRENWSKQKAPRSLLKTKPFTGTDDSPRTNDWVEEDEAVQRRKDEYERYKCRFGFPHRLSKTTRFMTSQELKRKVRGDRMYTLKRLSKTSRRIVGYNMKFLKLFRCNMDIQLVTDVWATIEYLFSYVTKPEGQEKEIIREMARSDEDSDRSFVFRMCNAVLSHRQVGKAEAAMNVLGIPFYHCTTSSTFLDLRASDDRCRMLKKSALRGTCSDESFVDTMVDHYRNRRLVVNGGEGKARLLELCLYDFTRWFVPDKVREVGENVDADDAGCTEHEDDESGENESLERNLEIMDDEHETEDTHMLETSDRHSDCETDGDTEIGGYCEENDLVPYRSWMPFGTQAPFLKTESRKLPRIVLSNNRVLRMRRTPKFVGFDHRRTSRTEDMRKLLNLLVCVTSEEEAELQEEILDERISEIYQTYLGEITEAVNRLPNHIMAFAKQVVEDLSDGKTGYGPLPRSKATRKRPRLFGTGEGNEITDDDDGTRTIDDDVEVSDDDETGEGTYVEIDESKFTADQLEVYLCVKKYLNDVMNFLREHPDILWEHISKITAHEEYPKPFHIFVQGAAGTGKSFLIESLKTLAKNHCIREKVVKRVARYKAGILLGAYTGCAAVNIGGTTLHDLFGFGVSDFGNGSVPLHGSQLVNNLKQRICNSLFLVIDEISMVPQNLFSQINTRMNELCCVTHRPDVVFGGKPVVVLGDLLQLSPVCAKFVFEKSSLPFNIWNVFQPVLFNTNMRQNNDNLFARCLEDMRCGDLSDEFDQLLKHRCINPFVNPESHAAVKAEYDNEFADATHLFPFIEQTELHNKKKLEETAKKSQSSVFVIKSKDTLEAQNKNKANKKAKTDKTVKVPRLKKGKDCGLLKELHLCVGATVMLTTNLDTNSGLVNGAMGAVTNFLWWDSAKDEYQTFVNLKKFPRVPVATDVLGVKYCEIPFPDAIEICLQRDNATVQILPHEIVFVDQNKNKIRRKQFPLTLGFGLTIHKSQGATIKKGVVNLNFKKWRCEGGFYVAISRFPMLKSFVILDYNRESFHRSKKGLAEIKRLEHLVTPLSERSSLLGMSILA